MSASMGVGANYLEFTGGSAGAAGTGAYTIAALVRPAAGNNNMGIATLLTSGTRVRSLFEDALKLFGESDFTGFGSLTQGQWYVLVESKAAGAGQNYTFDIWVYDPVDFTGALSTGNGGTSGDGTSINEIRFGQAIDNSNGLYAVLGIWTRQLSLAERQSLRTNRLADWAATSGGAPAELIHTRDWDGATGTVTAVGTASFVGVTGTVSAGANPDGFDFDLTSTVSGAGTADAVSTAVAVGRVRVHAAGTADAVSTASAAARVRVHAAGTADAVSTTSAVARVRVHAAGSAAAVSTAVMTVITDLALTAVIKTASLVRKIRTTSQS